MEYEVYMKLLVDKDAFTVEYELLLKIAVDEGANFLEVDIENHSEILKELTLNAMYDIDDIKILECEVNKYDK